MAAEAEGVADGDVDGPAHPVIRRGVEVALGIGVELLMVGGTSPVRATISETANSSAPAAPSRWPVIDLVEPMISLRAWSPNTALIASVSSMSPCGRGGAVGVDVVHVRRGRSGHRRRRRASRAAAPSPPSARRGHVVGVAARAVADHLAQDRGAAPLARAPGSRGSRCRRPRPARSRRGRGRRGGWPSRVSRCGWRAPSCSGSRRSARPVMAASAPPVTIASASPSRIMLNESPIACALDAQAVTVAKFGPLARTGWRRARPRCRE